MQTPVIPPLETAELGADWLRRQGIEVSSFGERVAAVIAVVWNGIYNAPLTDRCRHGVAGRADEIYGRWSDKRMIVLAVRGGMASWDVNTLTRLVVACHDACLRVEVNPRSFRHLELVFSIRKRTNGLMEGHPTLEHASEVVRRGYKTRRAT